ncbi:MAG: septal ring lytic transglycosylase RlpA family protein [Pseudomonadota bacterium]
MRKRFFIPLLIIFTLFSCAREKQYVRTTPPPPSKKMILPETKDGKTPPSYEVNGQRYYPLPDAEGFVQYGKASWYGRDFQGRPTSSGEIYDMYGESAAHKTIPLGTYVKVQNLSNGKEIVVKVNDRGPFVKGRVIDLSYAAGKELDMIGQGVVDAKVTALGREVEQSASKKDAQPLVEYQDPKRGEFTIQVGAFQSKTNAERLADRLKVLFDYVNVTTTADEKRTTLYRVHVSKSETLDQAGEIEKRLENMGFTEAFVVRL